MDVASDILNLIHHHGHSEYGGEGVAQLQHALQCAVLAEAESAGPALVVAALLHDIGHLLHDLPDDAPDQASTRSMSKLDIGFSRANFLRQLWSRFDFTWRPSDTCAQPMAIT